MPKLSLMATLFAMAAALTLSGCVGAGVKTFVACPKTQPVSGCKIVSKCEPGNGTPGSAPLICK